MNTKKVVLTCTLLTLVSGGIAMAGSQQCRSGEHMGRHHDKHGLFSDHMISHLSEELELSEVQEDQIRSIADETREEFGGTRNSMRQLRTALMELDISSESYQDELNELADRAADSARSTILYFGELKLRVVTVLTPEQQKQLESLMQKHMERKSKRMEKHSS